jgi:hypothetical protein
MDYTHAAYRTRQPEVAKSPRFRIKFETGRRHVRARALNGNASDSRSGFDSTAGRTEATMSHSKSLQTRRRKQKGKKHLKNLTKQAKKLNQKKAQ